MTLNELMELCRPMQEECGGFDVVVPIGMDCATAQLVEPVAHDPRTGKTYSVKRGRQAADTKIVILVSPSNEPRP